ncbi:acyl-CoA transferase [Bordetella pertussis]|uniref:CoA transferase n=42 Tax=Bordetella pertussis TaxID=520 RepID=Q7W097_BORPE|nr:CoA transferase [Bordetella pertussis]ETH38007.1 CoA-transferase family III protein [Bordetella pertussis H918]ETH41712.1 CoA-transferase family III protein [Bordetella pertussis H939]ETH46779.1 CoA-transferase family III protein [Bordetella pertussis H921]ETH70605.1 CoA-transferase family III protein [Bordetella pertussis STO1-CHLA-0011]ETH83210.1 CoA-transferase family III protein [Bordetella pertussis STO1-CHOC-0017]ETH88114.1 CoA-transferase family III protein [Bordetella pertussis STO
MAVAALPPGALQGCRVIDLSRVLGGPYCTQILADHGADVLKIEPPGGDETRGWGPPFSGQTASYFIGVNRNKRGMALDLSQPAGQELLRGLLADADVLVENFKPGTLEKWGLGYDTLSQAFPRLVHCRVSGFGADGPLGGLPGYDACAQAMCGLMSVNGEADGPATRVGLPVVDMVTGLNAAVAVLLALQERQRSGLGQFLDITLYDCALSLLHPHAPNYFYSGRVPTRTGNAHPNIAPYKTLPTGAGPIFLAVGNNRQFAALADALGAPQLAQDARFASNAERLAHRDALCAALTELLRPHEAASLAERLLRLGVPAAAVLDVAQALDHPHARHRGMLLEAGDYRGIASPIKLSRTPARLRSVPPALQEPAGA